MVLKDCPLCGESMQLREGEATERVPGYTQTKTQSYREWVCPECDYFEEVEPGDIEEG
jgi:acetone carboxylase gamma subunit